MGDAFYRRADDGFVASPLTAGPWNAALQHAGPPAALVARALTKLPSAQPRRIATITCDILRPIPVGSVSLTTRVLRAGANADLVEGSLLGDGDQPVMVGRAWRLPVERTCLPPDVVAAETHVPPFDGSAARPFFPVQHDVGYHSATEWRFARGGWLQPGSAAAWMRMLVPLVEGEQPSHIERLLVAADSTSGVAATLDPTKFFFMNVDLRVNVDRRSDDEWVGMDASSEFQHSRIGFARSRLFDREGAVGMAAQTLLVSERGGRGQ